MQPTARTSSSIISRATRIQAPTYPSGFQCYEDGPVTFLVRKSTLDFASKLQTGEDCYLRLGSSREFHKLHGLPCADFPMNDSRLGRMRYIRFGDGLIGARPSMRSPLSWEMMVTPSFPRDLYMRMADHIASFRKLLDSDELFLSYPQTFTANTVELSEEEIDKILFGATFYSHEKAVEELVFARHVWWSLRYAAQDEDARNAIHDLIGELGLELEMENCITGQIDVSGVSRKDYDSLSLTAKAVAPSFITSPHISLRGIEARLMDIDPVLYQGVHLKSVLSSYKVALKRYASLTLELPVTDKHIKGLCQVLTNRGLVTKSRTCEGHGQYLPAVWFSSDDEEKINKLKKIIEGDQKLWRNSWTIEEVGSAGGKMKLYQLRLAGKLDDFDNISIVSKFYPDYLDEFDLITLEVIRQL